MRVRESDGNKAAADDDDEDEAKYLPIIFHSSLERTFRTQALAEAIGEGVIANLSVWSEQF